MFGAIDAGLIMEVSKSMGYYTQLELDLDCPPVIELKEEYCCDIYENLNVVYDKHGKNYSYLKSVQHPSFTAVRNWLEENGYIKVQRSWSNGDTVLEPFYINNVFFDVGVTFPCASAMGIKLFRIN